MFVFLAGSPEKKFHSIDSFFTPNFVFPSCNQNNFNIITHFPTFFDFLFDTFCLFATYFFGIYLCFLSFVPFCFLGTFFSIFFVFNRFDSTFLAFFLVLTADSVLPDFYFRALTFLFEDFTYFSKIKCANLNSLKLLSI